MCHNQNMEEPDIFRNYEKKGYLNTDFQMFYLSDKEPKEFENHYHEFDKITIFLRGKVTYIVEGKSYELEPYDIVLVGHHDIHKLYVDKSTRYDRIIMYISPEFLERYSSQQYQLDECFQKAKREHANVLRIAKLSESKLYQVVMELKQTLDPGRSHEEYARELYLRTVFLEFMVHLNRAAIGEKISYVNTNICNQKVVDIIDFINANLTENLAIDFLAAHFYMSKYHMMRIFKEETGYSIGKYISNKRLLRAKEYIQEGMPITQACYTSGFKEHSTFSRAYKNLFGESPREMRKKKFL
ncbi:MAG: AraC family transcriptional regulator [Lachnospiraceae bacterium]|nr:AraC family transcriptional regulator [Lachnospiraceae bacterium]